MFLEQDQKLDQFSYFTLAMRKLKKCSQFPANTWTFVMTLSKMYIKLLRWHVIK